MDVSKARLSNGKGVGKSSRAVSSSRSVNLHTSSRGKSLETRALCGSKISGSSSRSNRTVIVVDATGYVAQGVIRSLVQNGYKVRGTVQSLTSKKTAHLKKNFPSIELFEADHMLADSSDDLYKAMRGCGVVMCGDDTPMRNYADPEKELIAPAVNGTKRVMNAAIRAGVGRIVLTSSIAAIMHSSKMKGQSPYTEDDWCDAPAAYNAYAYTKVTSEKLAWEMVKGTKVKLTVLNPGFVLGPITEGQSDGTFVEWITGMLDGTKKRQGLDHSSFPIVDVRDLGQAHVSAMETEAACGKRFIVSSAKSYTPLELANMLRKKFAAYELPLEGPDVKERSVFSNEQARKILKYQPRPVAESVCDMAQDAIKYGLVTKKGH